MKRNYSYRERKSGMKFIQWIPFMLNHFEWNPPKHFFNAMKSKWLIASYLIKITEDFRKWRTDACESKKCNEYRCLHHSIIVEPPSLDVLYRCLDFVATLFLMALNIFAQGLKYSKTSVLDSYNENCILFNMKIYVKPHMYTYKWIVLLFIEYSGLQIKIQQEWVKDPVKIIPDK